MFKKATAFIAAAAAVGAVVPAYADDAATENAKLRAEMAELRAEVGQTRMEASRAQDIKNMVSGVLEDSESRRSLSAAGAVAGHDGGFFLSSADGKFFMGISGFIQIRYYANFREDTTTGVAGTNDHEVTSGFDLTEGTLEFAGHVFNEDILYSFAITMGNDQDVVADTLAIGYAGFFDGLEVWLGYGVGVDMTLEEAAGDISAVETTVTTGLFDAGTGTGESDLGLSASYSQELFRINISFVNNDSSDWSNNTGYMLSARGELKLLGSWDQTDDTVSWGGEDVLLVFGLGLQLGYSTDETNYAGTVTDDSDWMHFGWTVDVRWEWNGLSAWVAGLGAHGNAANGSSYDIYGVIGQISYNIMDTVEIFVRGEGIFMHGNDGGADFGAWNRAGGVGIVTVGGTWFLYGHDLKFTVDVGVATDDIPNDNYADRGFLDSPVSGNPDDDALQVVIRAQVQLLF